MKDNGKTTTTSPKQVLEDLRALVADAEKMLGDLPSADDAVGSLRARFESAQERISDLYTGARKKVVSSAKQTDHAIRSNPYQSLAIAAGVGVVIGMIVARRKKE
jgi:ElaB/YqjD/DUF883 family membrane-anchored ribosome-binding protein